MFGEVKVKRVSVMQIKAGTFSQSAAKISAMEEDTGAAI